MELVEQSRKIHDIVVRYQDLIGSEAMNLASTLAIDRPEKLQALLAEIEREGRSLSIGVVGRVKSGKSSLLNALFFDGAEILPKAATPMTAALTVLAYGEQPTVEAEYYTENDIEDMRSEHEHYEARIEELFKDELARHAQRNKSGTQPAGKIENDKELHEKMRRRAKSKLSGLPLAAAALQYEDIRKSHGNRPAKDTDVFVTENFDALKELLADYIGVGGRYTPFTKSITLRLPEEKLRDVEIVDTPGINDPVVSREERTKALLKKCDVVFVVSPSGQFLSQEDLDLMDRVSGREGASEIYLVNSKVDSLLHSPEQLQATPGQFDQALNSINGELREQARKILSNTRQKSPEVGACYDKIIDDTDSRMAHSSAICFVMARQFDNRPSWGDEEKHAWGLLSKNYPDFFSDHDRETSLSSLNRLAGTERIRLSLEGVRQQKDEIMRQRLDTLVRNKVKSLVDYREELINAARNRLSKIQATSIEELDDQLSKLEKSRNKAGSAVDNEYAELVAGLCFDIKGIKGKLERHFRNTRNDVKSMEETKTESYEVDVTSGPKKFFTLGICRDYETRSYEVVSVRTGAVINAIEEMKIALETEVDLEISNLFKSWRQQLYQRLVSTLRASVEQETDLDDTLIGNAIGKVCANLATPEIELEEQQIAKNKEKAEESSGEMHSALLWALMPFSSLTKDEERPILRARGTITGSEAEDFIEAAKNEITRLKKKLNQQIDRYIKDLEGKLSRLAPAAKIFTNYESDIENLKQQRSQLALTTSRIEALVRELQSVGIQALSSEE